MKKLLAVLTLAAVLFGATGLSASAAPKTIDAPISSFAKELPNEY